MVTSTDPGEARPCSPFSLRGIYFHDGFTFEPEAHAPLHWDFDAWKG
jgi:hypothetical protein